MSLPTMKTISIQICNSGGIFEVFNYSIITGEINSALIENAPSTMFIDREMNDVPVQLDTILIALDDRKRKSDKTSNNIDFI